jgi:hypothetical protein
VEIVVSYRFLLYLRFKIKHILQLFIYFPTDTICTNITCHEMWQIQVERRIEKKFKPVIIIKKCECYKWWRTGDKGNSNLVKKIKEVKEYMTWSWDLKDEDDLGYKKRKGMILLVQAHDGARGHIWNDITVWNHNTISYLLVSLCDFCYFLSYQTLNTLRTDNITILCPLVFPGLSLVPEN